MTISFEKAWRDYDDEDRRTVDPASYGTLKQARLTHDYYENAADDGYTTFVTGWIPPDAPRGPYTNAVVARDDALSLLEHTRRLFGEFLEYSVDESGDIRYIDHINALKGTLHSVVGGRVDTAPFGYWIVDD